MNTEYGFNVQPDPLGRALEAARRATDAAPSNHFAYLALAPTLFFRKEFQAFRSAAERALTLNPMDSGTMAYLGTLISLAGDWERGCALVQRAIQLNPKHPGWYWFPHFYNAYRKSDYRGALNFALKINMPRFYATHLMAAAAYGQLGERDAATKALRELLVLWPSFGVSAREEMGKWCDPDLVEHLIDGFRKAGLEIADNGSSDSPTRGETFTDSRQRRSEIMGAAPAKSIAVLPFVNLSADKNDEYLSDGMTEELINALAKVQGCACRGAVHRSLSKGKTRRTFSAKSVSNCM